MIDDPLYNYDGAFFIKDLNSNAVNTINNTLRGELSLHALSSVERMPSGVPIPPHDATAILYGDGYGFVDQKTFAQQLRHAIRLIDNHQGAIFAGFIDRQKEDDEAYHVRYTMSDDGALKYRYAYIEWSPLYPFPLTEDKD